MKELNDGKSEKKDDAIAQQALLLRGPSQISFDITNRCNFRCLHCFNRSGEVNSSELTNNEVLELIKDIVFTKPFNFCFCGGEPLLREKVLCESATILTNQGIMVSMVTNGYLLNKARAVRLKKAGISRIQVSLDGAKAKTHETLR